MHNAPGRYRLIHEPTGVLVAQVERASSLWQMGIGLIGRPSLPADSGLWLPGAASVHTFFVRFPIDLLFLDKDLRQTAAVSDVLPWRPFIRGAGGYHTVELAAGRLSEVVPKHQTGDRWRLEQI